MKTKPFKQLERFASVGIREAFIIEKKSGMPQRFKTPRVKIKWVTV